MAKERTNIPAAAIHYDILSALRKFERVTATDLVEILGKHKSTISPCVQNLVARKLVREAGTADTTARAGKPRVYLELDPLAATFLGVELSATFIRVFVLDGQCRSIAQGTFPYSGTSAETLLSDIHGSLGTALQWPLVGTRRLNGIGVGFSGHVNSTEGIIYESHTFGLRDYPLRAELERAYGVPCHVVNDANAAMVAEKFHVLDRGPTPCRNALFLFFGPTFLSAGFGMVLNDQLFEGSSYRAGELYDYQQIAIDVGLINRFPFRTLRSFTPPRQITADRELPPAVPGMLRAMMDNVIDQLIATYRMINPDLAIIGGDLLESHPDFHLAFIDLAREKVSAALEGSIRVDIRPSKLSTQAVAIGACVPLFEAHYRKVLSTTP